MEKRMKLRIWLCLAVVLMIPGIIIGFASGMWNIANTEAETGEEADLLMEVPLVENNAGTVAAGGSAVLYAALDASGEEEDTELLAVGEDVVIEDEEEILLVDYGKYSGAQVYILRSSHVNATDNKINYLKKTFTNATTGGTYELLDTANRCFSLISEFVSIGPYAFAGANNANPNYSSTMQTRINTYLKEVAFETGSEMVSIDEYAFSNAGVLVAFDGVNATKLTKLGDCVFYNDRALATIVLPGSITSVGTNTFTTNNSSTKVIVPEGSTTDKLFQGSYVFNLPGNVYYTYSGVDPADNSLKKFGLTFSGSNYDAKVYVNGSEIATYSSIAVGSKVKVSLQPKTGYRFKSDPVSSITAATSGYTCSANGSGYEIEFTMTKDATITIGTEILQYALKVSVADNFGSGTTKVTVSGKDTVLSSNPFEQKYDYGTKLTVSFSPGSHYYLGNVTLDNVKKDGTSAVEITMDQDHEVTASYLPESYTLSAIFDSAKGRITGNEGSYTYGTQASLTIEPLVGYEIAEILVNGSKVSVTSNLKLYLEKDTSVQAIFKKKTYTIDMTGDYVTVTNNVSGVFEYGTDVTLKFIADEGYRITDVLVDEKSVGAVSAYLFSGLNADHTVEVCTERVTYQITVNADEHVIVSNEPFAAISGNGNDGAEEEEKEEKESSADTDDAVESLKTVFYYGETPEFYFTAMDGYVISDVLLDGASLGARASYSFPELRKDYILAVLAEEIKKEDTAEQDGENGSGSDADGNSVGGGDGTDAGDGENSAGTGGTSGENSGGDSDSGSGADGSSGSGLDGSADAGEGSSGSAEDGSADAGTGSGGTETLQDKLDNQYPDKTGYDVDDEGNAIDKTATVIKLELDSNGGLLRYDYLLYHLGAAFRLPVPVRDGYDFAGWYLGDKKIETTKAVLSQTDKLVACWTPAVYRITYDLNGGIFNNASKVAYLYTITKSTSLVKPKRDGYVFGGWYLKGTDIKLKKIQKGWYYGGTLELEAKWYLKNSGSYTVANKNASTGGKIVYDLAGGYFKDLSKVQEYYAFMTTTSLPKPARTGYVFEGWYIEGTDVRLTKISKNQYLGDLKLVAAWSRSHYTITYCTNKGKGKQDKTTLVYDDSALVSGSLMTRKGYIFTGWNTKANGTGISYQPGDEVKNLTLKTNIKLYAQWQKLF